MRFLKKFTFGESGQPSEFHRITDLTVNRDTGVATVVLKSWANLAVAKVQGTSVDEQAIDIHVGAWAPELAFQLLDLIATLPTWAGAEILDQD
jgi:hypothetical protein